MTSRRGREAALACADDFTVRDGNFASDALVFDPRPFGALAQQRVSS
ncbi:MAG TPA: hypothetical protein VMU65_00660 [Candidatus Saccharimonadales bacterium]|nr:hypothetical protein [Candidatus Saccharimonadales bacterium]